MGSVVLPSNTPGARRITYSCSQPPPLPPRPRSLAIAVAVPPLKLQSVTESGGMDSRYYRASSPRSRTLNPARSSTGTFADPYYDSAYYGRGATSPRTSGERIPLPAQPIHTYAPSSSSSSGSRTSKYDTYSGRPRRNTHNESDDRLVRPNVREAPATTSMPIRAPGIQHQHHLDRPSSPLARSWDSRADTYITPGHARREHKRIYSVDDNSHQAKLVAEREVVQPSRRESGDPRGYSVTSGGRSYHQSKPPLGRTAELGDEGYSYTDAAGMYRDTEPAWRRPRAGSIERGSRPTSMMADKPSRPTSMILDKGPRTSNRELGPPPSTRGFDKINNGVPRTASLRDRHARSSSIERSRDIPKYEAYPEVPTRSASARHKPTAVHQEPREHRREPYNDEYDRRDRDVENRRHNTAVGFEDREVATRGFGIAPGLAGFAQDSLALERQPIYNAPDVGRARPEEYATPYYSADRAEARMPEPRAPEPRMSRERDVAPTYEERPRERERDHDRGHVPAIAPVAVAGVAAGAAATYGAAEVLRRDKDRDRDRDSDRERERRKEWDERDRRDRVSDERRERVPEERHDRVPEERRDRAPEERLPPAAAAYASIQEPERKVRERRYEDDEVERKPRERRHEDHDSERKPRERRYEDDDGERKPREHRHEDDDRERRARRAPSSDGSDNDRPRHYADKDAGRESERRKEVVPQEAALDPDEEYRRRIQQEMERSSIAGPDREYTELDRDKERRRRKENRDRSRDRSLDPRSRGAPSNVAEPAHSRYDERSGSVLDTDFTQEPDSLTSPAVEFEFDREQPSKNVQIVTPPKEPPPQPKGILRKPTQKFPEHPDPIREGVAPHKSQLKGKDIPIDARWTKIDRRLVNPEALEEAKERFEERMDCVIVLRVLTKQDIQKLADRTKEIRETRENEYERHDRRDRDRRSHRSHRDDEDRDRHRDYDDTDEDDIGRDRERDRERDRPRMIEDGRHEKEKSEQRDRKHDQERNERHKKQLHDETSDESSDEQDKTHWHGDSDERRPGRKESKLKHRLSRVLDWL